MRFHYQVAQNFAIFGQTTTTTYSYLDGAGLFLLGQLGSSTSTQGANTQTVTYSYPPVSAIAPVDLQCRKSGRRKGHRPRIMSHSRKWLAAINHGPG